MSDYTPTEALLLDVLAARFRLGDRTWTFRPRERPTLLRLANRGLVTYKRGSAPSTLLAWLTEKGRSEMLLDGYTSSAQRRVEELEALLDAKDSVLHRFACETRDAENHAEKLERFVDQAMHLCMYGERAPGGNETWADWATRAEAYMRKSMPDPSP